MEKERKIKLIVRWSIFTAGSIALFWFIWYLITGSVPTVTSIRITTVTSIIIRPEWTIQLPFGISRWWDILIGPIWFVFCIPILTKKEVAEEYKDLTPYPFINLGCISIFVLVFALFFIANFYFLGLICVSVIVLVLGLLAPIPIGPIFLLGCSSFCGLFVGLHFNLILTSILGIAYLLRLTFRKICPFIESIGNWLLVQLD